VNPIGPSALSRRVNLYKGLNSCTVAAVATLFWAVGGLAQSVPSASSQSGAAPANIPSEAAKSAGDVTAQSSQSEHERAEQELKEEERQRILGVVPNFNMTDVQNAAPLTAGQKFRLAFRSTVDPFQFVAAGLDAGWSQWQDDFPGYGQGGQGYGKRYGAAFADQFSGTIWGNAVFPSLLHEDPRYFRKGTGTIKRRLLYSISTTVWTKNDDGTWGPNYANILGNIAAGGLANLYYPSTDRGVGLTFERAFTVTAEGTAGAVFIEFWPDINRKLFHRHDVKNTP